MMEISGALFLRLTATWEAEDVLDMLERLSAILDIIVPDKTSPDPNAE